jgi:hypothetical protein
MALIQSSQIQYPLSGSFSGSFYGDGSGLTNLTGLNSFQIASGSVSASVNISGNIFLIKSSSVNFLTITSNTTTIQNDIFLIKNLSGQTTFTVSQSIVYFSTQSAPLSNASALAGGIYFTSASFYVGLEN